MKNLLALFVVVLGMVAFAAGSAAAQTAVTLQLNWKPEPQFGGFYEGQRAGVYEKNGLKVDVRPGGVGTPTIQMVGAGQVPFAIVSADELVLARSKGNKVVALFAVYQTNPQAIMARASRNLTDIGQLFDGGTVALQSGLPYAQYLFKKYDVNKKKAAGQVRIVPSPGGDLSVFRQDANYAMQCFATSEPLAAKAAGVEPKVFLVAEAGFNPYTTVLVTTEDYLAQNPQVCKQMVTAVRQAWTSYLANPADTDKLMNGLNPTMDLKTMAASGEAQKPLIQTSETEKAGLGLMTEARWQALIDQMKDLGLVQNPPAAKDCFRWGM